MTEDRLDIHDMVNQLVRFHRHRERYIVRVDGTAWTRHHVTEVPSLIHQLQHATAASTGEPGSGGFQSRPAAHLESLDTLVRIDLAAAAWVRDLGEDDPGDTAACIRKLHGLAASAERPAQDAIAADIRRWWSQARVVTGWDSPAWRPDNTCPVCSARGSLRVRLSAQSAVCTDCHETWTAETIGLLAEHIRAENSDEDTAEVLALEAG